MLGAASGFLGLTAPPTKDGYGLTNGLRMLPALATEGAYADAALNFKKDADEFAREVMKLYPDSAGYSKGLRQWIFETAKHYYWQMMLTVRYGPGCAEAVGDIHETGLLGDRTTVDRLVDLHNNRNARAAAEDLEATKILRKARLEQMDVHGDIEWERMQTKIRSSIRKYITDLIEYSIKNKHKGAIVYPDDPRIVYELGARPGITPSGDNRLGWEGPP